MKCYRRLLVHLCTLLLISSVLSLPAADRDLDQEFEQWKTTHKKQYSTPEEEAKRRAMWEESRVRVETHNKEADQGMHTYRIGLNKFSDMTAEEVPTGLLPRPPNPDPELDQEFAAWKTKHRKTYSTPEEEAKRRAIWEESRRKIEAHNKEHAEGLHTHTLGMNHFSDLKPEEVPKGLLPPPRNTDDQRNPELDHEFAEWRRKHRKTYKTPAEEAKRRAIWEETRRSVEAHNKEYEQGLHTYTQGMNQFSDMKMHEMPRGIPPPPPPNTDDQSSTDLDQEFAEWKRNHSKVYSTPEEEAKRRAIWEETRRSVEAHNKEYEEGLQTYTKGMNQFSDMKLEEMPGWLGQQNNTRDLDQEFAEWKTTHSKEYSTPEEEAERRAIWEESRRRVEAHNKEADQGLHTYKKGLNQFSDRKKEEMPLMRIPVPGN